MHGRPSEVAPGARWGHGPACDWRRSYNRCDARPSRGKTRVVREGPGPCCAAISRPIIARAMAGTLSSPILIGRDTAMTPLIAALERSTAGEPRVVLIGGDAGLGKTRLVTEFGARAEADGGRMIVGACLDLRGDGIPYGPFLDALRALGTMIGPEALGELLGPVGLELATLAPGFARYVGATAGGPGRARRAGGPCRGRPGPVLRAGPRPPRAPRRGQAARARARGPPLERPGDARPPRVRGPPHGADAAARSSGPSGRSTSGPATRCSPTSRTSSGCRASSGSTSGR